ncbi:GTP cyclohydrolase FolE2 [Halanaerocella petrolearia]
MKDVQNIKGDYTFSIDEVGVENIKYPLRIETKSGELISTVGEISLAVNLTSDLKGINMSRLPEILAELEVDNWVLTDFKNDLQQVLEKMQSRMETKNAYLELVFDYFLTKAAPVSQKEALVSYQCKVEASLEGKQDDSILTVEVPITSLCPCSKEISDYSAHNQRGYVQVSVRYDDQLWLEELIEKIESVASSEVYSILKRVDEKEVTERAYENPRFVEDIVRLVAEELSADNRINWFKVRSSHEESIHPHNAYAVLEQNK